MQTFILTLHFFLCLFLIGSILLQAGKGADIGAAFGAGGSQTVFGPRGAATFLSKLTAIVAILFLLTSVGLARYAKKGGQASVLERVPIQAPSEAIPPQPEEMKKEEGPPLDKKSEGK